MKVDIPQITTKPFSDLKLWQEQYHARKEKLLDVLNTYEGFSFINNLEHMVVVSKSLKGYEWQVSVFDEKGAIYDTQHNKPEEVVAEIISNKFGSIEVITKEKEREDKMGKVSLAEFLDEYDFGYELIMKKDDLNNPEFDWNWEEENPNNKIQLSLIDYQGAYLGNIDNDRFDISDEGLNNLQELLVDRLDVYVRDYDINATIDVLEDEHGFERNFLDDCSVVDLMNLMVENGYSKDTNMLSYICGEDKLDFSDLIKERDDLYKFVGKKVMAYEDIQQFSTGEKVATKGRSVGFVCSIKDNEVQFYQPNNPQSYQNYAIDYDDFKKWVADGLYKLKSPTSKEKLSYGSHWGYASEKSNGLDKLETMKETSKSNSNNKTGRSEEREKDGEVL